jgi:hypothetical protein
MSILSRSRRTDSYARGESPVARRPAFGAIGLTAIVFATIGGLIAFDANWLAWAATAYLALVAFALAFFQGVGPN